ncbi:DUF1801 domain-containing protein [Pedobacter sp. PWIIR3]
MNPEVTQLLNQLNHPLREQIEELRAIILNADQGMKENVKWNGPNYTFKGNDRITLRVHPPGALNLILHLGVKAVPLAEPWIMDDSKLLQWKSNDRAVIDLKKPVQFEVARPQLANIIKKWIAGPI